MAQPAFVSQWVIDSFTLEVVSADDAIKSVQLFNDTTHRYETATGFTFNRFCSGDLAPISAYSFVDTRGTASTADDVTYGTQDRIYLTGEEFSSTRLKTRRHRVRSGYPVWVSRKTASGRPWSASWPAAAGLPAAVAVAGSARTSEGTTC